MKVAYILSEFPSTTETFALREMKCLADMGWEPVVLAAGCQKDVFSEASEFRVVYRPALLSLTSLAAIVYMLRHYPAGMLRLMLLVVRIVADSPKEALGLVANIHTLGHFARRLDSMKIPHVHAYFLSWPACIGLGLKCVTRRSLSLAAHARDIFVESGALTEKARRASFLVTCTEQGLAALQERLPRELHQKLHLARHGIDATTVRAVCGRGRENPLDGAHPPLLLTVGRLVPKKGHEILIRAFHHLRRDDVSCRLAIVGEGPERASLEKLIQGLGLEREIALFGRLDNPSVLRLMSSAAVLVAPSVIAPDGDRDGAPNVILEALAIGLPVIGSRLDGIREALADGRTGVLVEPGDSQALAGAIRGLLEDNERGRVLSAAGRKYVEEHYCLKRNVKRIMRLLERVA